MDAFIATLKEIGTALSPSDWAPDMRLLDYALAFVPTVLALCTRAWHIVGAVFLVNGAMVLAGRGAEPRHLAVLAGLAVIVFLIGYGLDRRRQQQALADAASELDRVDSRMTGFLEALDRRSSLLEDDAVDRTRRILTAEIQADQSRQQAQRPAAAMAAPSLPNPAPKSV